MHRDITIRQQILWLYRIVRQPLSIHIEDITLLLTDLVVVYLNWAPRITHCPLFECTTLLVSSGPRQCFDTESCVVYACCITSLWSMYLLVLGGARAHWSLCGSFCFRLIIHRFGCIITWPHQISAEGYIMACNLKFLLSLMLLKFGDELWLL